MPCTGLAEAGIEFLAADVKGVRVRLADPEGRDPGSTQLRQIVAGSFCD